MAPADAPTIDAFDYLLTLDEVPKNAVNLRNNTPLFEAFVRDWQIFAIKLIKAGCEIFDTFSDGNTALHWAIQNGWIEVAELLIENGFHVDKLNSQGKTALNIACCFELVDEIWMLLFYGADPHLARCFDICATKSVKAEVQEIFLDHLIGYNVSFNLMTFATLLTNNDNVNFIKVLQTANDINYTSNDLRDFCSRIVFFDPTLFQTFLEKFQDIAHNIFTRRYLINVFLSEQRKENLANYIKNLFVLFESPLSNFLVDEVHYCVADEGIELVPYMLFSCVEYDKTPETATLLLCFLLSLGVDLTVQCMDVIFLSYGYCNLFKVMLHMDIVDTRDLQVNYVVPHIIYNIKQTSNTIAKNIVQFNFIDTNIYKIFNYFALPKWIRMYVIDHYEYEPNNALSNLSTLTVVPSLVELARNCLHEYIVYKFKVKNSRQFYTLIKLLPIAQIHKEILSYERQLYFLD
ncbi:hypothetical protein Zmor_005251 [Zophobas morio]|uniref:Uncharacterized protein n=1 Tax=Zophobas morio TaxID=2755281 RepID=A0AA38IRS3_9CUCU|nr:hypothetical protein Zmor_005251 [Zophobas morio]